MARPSKHDGVVYRRKDGKILVDALPGSKREAHAESTLTEGLAGGQQQLRERLQARDNNVLDIVRKGEQLIFGEWADSFLENYSKPPIRAAEDPRGEHAL